MARFIKNFRQFVNEATESVINVKPEDLEISLMDKQGQDLVRANQADSKSMTAWLESTSFGEAETLQLKISGGFRVVSGSMAATTIAVKDWSLIKNPTDIDAANLKWDSALNCSTITFNSSNLMVKSPMPGTGPYYAKQIVFQLVGNVEGGKLTVKINLEGTQILGGLPGTESPIEQQTPPTNESRLYRGRFR